MPISGLSLTLSQNEDCCRRALGQIRGAAGFELGERSGPRIAAVMETHSEDENRALWRWLNELEGVTHVDVVFVSLDQDSELELATSDSPSKEGGQS